jgi:hypothetical protein
MKNNIQEIYYKFDGKLIGTAEMKRFVCETLALMEEEIINYITSGCWFFGSMEDSLAFTFTGNDLKNQHLIFLSDELFLHDDKQIMYTISHEIGHVMLGHRNSVLERQSKKEISNQEQGADKFARKYIQI